MYIPKPYFLLGEGCQVGKEFHRVPVGGFRDFPFMARIANCNGEPHSADRIKAIASISSGLTIPP
jgi:hypothetical protein